MEQLIFRAAYAAHLWAWKFGFREISYKLALYLIKYDSRKKLNMIKHIKLEQSLWDSEL